MNGKQYNGLRAAVQRVTNFTIMRHNMNGNHKGLRTAV